MKVCGFKSTPHKAPLRGVVAWEISVMRTGRQVRTARFPIVMPFYGVMKDIEFTWQFSKPWIFVRLWSNNWPQCAVKSSKITSKGSSHARCAVEDIWMTLYSTYNDKIQTIYCIKIWSKFQLVGNTKWVTLIYRIRKCWEWRKYEIPVK